MWQTVAQLVEIPIDRVDPEVLGALLEEFASRDGTDYGERETPLDQRVSQLHAQLVRGELQLLFDLDTETWDILSKENAQLLLQNG